MDSVKRELVWEATKEGKTIYLTGTVHTGCVEIPSAVREILPKITAVCLERVVDRPMGCFETLAFFTRYEALVIKSSWKHPQLTAIDINLVAERLFRACSDVFHCEVEDEDLEDWKAEASKGQWALGPLQCALATIGTLVKDREQLEGAKALDLLLAEDARKRKVRVVALESRRVHEEMRANATLCEALRIHKALTASQEKATAFVRSLVDFTDGCVRAVQSSDEEALWHACEHVGGIEHLTKSYLSDQRNKAMATKLDRLAKKNRPILGAAGAGHFLGENSIQSFLSSKGWSIVQYVRQPDGSYQGR